MKIKDIYVEDILKGTEYLGSGASKEVYRKGNKVIKVPRGRYILQEGGFGKHFDYPKSMNEVDDFLIKVDIFEPAMVWPLGQFAIEIIIWEVLQELKEKGENIDCFAKITDYYLDKNGVPVIEQELADDAPNIDYKEAEKILFDEIDALAPMLKDEYNIVLRDVRSGNCGFVGNKLKLFDFGISTTTSLDDYGSFSDYEGYEEDENEDNY